MARHAGNNKLLTRKLDVSEAVPLDVSSPTFDPDRELPLSATADGDSRPPPIRWSNVPPEAKSIVVICEDPDAPTPEPFVHWLVYDIPPTAITLGGPARPGVEGKNSAMRTGYFGASPPPGSGPHHYHFEVFALDTGIDMAPGAGRSAIMDAMEGHIIGCGDLVGTYERN
jgi:Raf kinase inhibitor-like YbhB/YbcL family protein